MIESYPPPEFVDLDHCQLAVRFMGDPSDVDVVCVHGWPLTGLTFRLVAQEMPGFRFHLIDLPGAGATKTTSATQYSIPDQAATVAAYVEKAGLEKCVFMAHNSGGAVARYAARTLKDRVHAMVLSDTEIPNHSSAALKAVVWGAHLPMAGWSTRKMFTVDALRKTNLSMGGCFNDPDAHPEFVELFVDPILNDDAVLDGYMRIARGITIADLDALSEVHKEIEAPVLLLWGQHDSFFGVEHARQMATQFSESEFHVHPDGRLFTHEEFPVWYAEKCLAFLRAI